MPPKGKGLASKKGLPATKAKRSRSTVSRATRFSDAPTVEKRARSVSPDSDPEIEQLRRDVLASHEGRSVPAVQITAEMLQGAITAAATEAARQTRRAERGKALKISEVGAINHPLNRDQFAFNEKIGRIIEGAMESIEEDPPDVQFASQALAEAKEACRQRQEEIRCADTSSTGWRSVVPFKALQAGGSDAKAVQNMQMADQIASKKAKFGSGRYGGAGPNGLGGPLGYGGFPMPAGPTEAGAMFGPLGAGAPFRQAGDFYRLPRPRGFPGNQGPVPLCHRCHQPGHFWRRCQNAPVANYGTQPVPGSSGIQSPGEIAPQ